VADQKKRKRSDRVAEFLRRHQSLSVDPSKATVPKAPSDHFGPGTFEEESGALRYLKKYYPKLYRERKARKTREHSVQQSKQYTSTATKRLRGA